MTTRAAIAAAKAALASRSSQPSVPPCTGVAPSTDVEDLLDSYRVRPDPAPATPTPATPTDPAAQSTSVGAPGNWRDWTLRGAPVAVVDLETTSKDPAAARIVEVAVVVVGALGHSEPYVALHQRVNPGIPIPPDATAIHGIRDADVADEPRWGTVWRMVLQAIWRAVPCAYNAPYDAQVLGAEATRVSSTARERAELTAIEWGRWLDPLVLARMVDQFENGKRLADVAARRGIAVDAHGAAGDAMATAMLLPRLLGEAARAERRRKPVSGRPTSADLATVGAYLDWQARTALAQERDLVEWQAQQGRRDPVDCPWHALAGLTVPEPAAKRAQGTAKCQSCGAPIVWAVTRDGRRIPLDPPEIRASEHGAGREVVLVVDGATRGRLREDPDGTVIGRESHFATCPQGPQHRKARKAEPAPEPTPQPPAGTQLELAGARVKVVTSPIGPRCTVLTDDLLLVEGSRVAADHVGDVVAEGRCVTVRVYSASGTLAFDEHGRHQTYRSASGWSFVSLDDGQEGTYARTDVRLAVPPPLLPPIARGSPTDPLEAWSRARAQLWPSRRVA